MFQLFFSPVILDFDKPKVIIINTDTQKLVAQSYLLLHYCWGKTGNNLYD